MLPNWHWLWLLLALVGGASSAWGHGEADDPLPIFPALGIQAKLAWRQLQQSQGLPSSQLAGYLLAGQGGSEPEDEPLEHANLALAWRLDEHWGIYGVEAWHGNAPPELEEVWLQGRHDLPDGSFWRLTVGRQFPAAGAVLGEAGVFDAFTLPLLAQRVVWGHPTGEDGLQLSWRGDLHDAALAVDAGFWQGRAFPGDERGPLVPSLHLGAQVAGLEFHAVGLHYQPADRGALRQRSVGHSHQVPTCEGSLVEVVCFQGTSDVLGASWSWPETRQQPEWPVLVQFAGWQRSERGTLRSINGQVDYQGTLGGAWLTVGWAFLPEWDLAWRGERVIATYILEGAGATMVAQDAGLVAYQPLTRQAGSLGYQPQAGVQWYLEYGEEQSATSPAVTYAALRGIFRFRQLWDR